MDERCVVAGALAGRDNRYSNGSIGLSTMNEILPVEEMAKLKAQNEQRQKEYARERVNVALLELAEKLVMRGKKPEEAFAIATDFITRANEVMKTFNLPE